jgi:nucleotide-binding universal stress UspA family protein
MKILLAIDGSKFSEAAIQAVIRQMRREDTEVRVLHVIEPLLLMTDAVLAESRDGAQELLTKTDELLRTAGFKVVTSVEDGDPRSKIVDSAQNWKADLIVVASHGRKGIDRLLIGSVSEAVARHAHCSVEIVREQATQAK